MDVPIASEDRKEQRFSVDLPVEVTWPDSKGNKFTEKTRIQDISKTGCRFKLSVQLQRGDVVSVLALGPSAKRINDNQFNLHEVRWTAPDGTGWTTGTLRLEHEELTSVVIPPANDRKLTSR